MKKPIILVLVGIALFIAIIFGILILMGVAGAWFYTNQRVENIDNKKQPPRLDSSTLKTIDLTGKEKDTERLFANLFKQGGTDAMKSYLDNTLTIPGNIKFQTPDGVFELKGVTNVALMEKEQKIKEWGDTNNRNLIQVVGIFPNGIGDEKNTFSLVFRFQDKIESK